MNTERRDKVLVNKKVANECQKSLYFTKENGNVYYNCSPSFSLIEHPTDVPVAEALYL